MVNPTKKDSGKDSKQDAQFEQAVKQLLDTPPQPKKKAENKKKKPAK